MSIVTRQGDRGQTGLVGGARVSKASLRVEAYGAVDELNSQVGFARAICPSTSIAELLKDIQRELFAVGGALATPVPRSGADPAVTAAMVERLTAEVGRVEAVEGVLGDWAIPGEHAASAALDVARTICRRAERRVVQLVESGAEISAELLAYLNRLSDLLWILGRQIEVEAGVDAALRTPAADGPKWSRAW
jgi:cob(I)alamin adenosyltransferase